MTDHGLATTHDGIHTTDHIIIVTDYSRAMKNNIEELKMNRKAKSND